MKLPYRTDTIALQKMMIDKEIRTIKELSEKSEVNRDTLAKILKGKITPSAVAMGRIAATLGMDSETAGRIFFAIDLLNTKADERR